MNYKNNKWKTGNILRILFVIFFFSSDILLAKYTKNIFDETKLKWKNEPINLSSIKKEILDYRNIQNIQNFNNSSLNLKDFEQAINPKISLIIPIYHISANIINFYLSIYYQSLSDIELIFINYISEDNTSQIIETLMKKDKRIIFINNTNQIRDFFPKRKGILIAKGEYILIIESDDLLLNNILEKSYLTAKNNNIDILQYYMIVGTYKNNRLWKNIKCNDGIIKYPKVEKFFYRCRYFNLLDKLIKREIFLKAIQNINDGYDIDEFNKIVDDDFAFFALSKKAKSYGFLEDVGYFYNLKSSGSTGHDNFLKNNTKNNWNNIFYKLFKAVKYFYEKTKNNRIEKGWVYMFFLKKIYNYRSKVIYLDNYFDFFNDTLNQFLSCSFFKKDEKNKILKFKNMIIEIKEKLDF